MRISETYASFSFFLSSFGLPYRSIYYLTPVPLNKHPFAWTSPDCKFWNQVISDTYQSKVCATHLLVALAHAGRHSIKELGREIWPLNTFSTLQRNPKPVFNQKTYWIMIGTIILVLALTESVSPHGLYIDWIIEERNEESTKDESTNDR